MIPRLATTPGNARAADRQRNVGFASNLRRTLRPKRLLFSLALGLATGLAGLALTLSPLALPLERRVGLDWLFQMRGPVPPPPQVAVIGINGRTGRALGLPKLPRDWPRSLHADLLKELVDRNAAVIVFDLDFSRAKPGDEDAIFARAVAEADRVVLFEWLAGRRERVVDSSGTGGGWTWVEEKQPPTEPLAAAAKALGPFPLPKLDQAVFEFWAFKPSTGGIPTTAAIALQLQALGSYERWLSVLKAAGLPGVEELPSRAAELTGPEDVRGLMLKLRRAFQSDPSVQQRIRRVLNRTPPDQSELPVVLELAALASLYAGPDHYYLNLYGPPGTIRTVPYEAVLRRDGSRAGQDLGDLTDHVVFVGYSDLYDPDQPDRFFTSFTDEDGVDLSGVEIMATAYSNLLTQRVVRPSNAATATFSVLCFGLVIGSVIYLLPGLTATLSAIALTGAYAAFVQWRFSEEAVWLPLAVPALVQLPMALLVGLIAQYLVERRKERRMARAVSYYLPENIARDLTEKEIDPETSNRVVFSVCLATDMSGFTTLSESKSPKELAIFMNEYFEALASVLKRHAVDVTEFHADTIMCAWTALERSPAVCRKALDAAIEVRQTIGRFAQEHGSMPLKPRIGLQDGYVYIGHTGGGGRFLYSILGDTANTAARLESLNKHLGTQVLAAESVIGNPDGLLLRPLGSFRLAGKADPTSVVEVLGKKSSASADQLDLCDAFAEAVGAFRSREWGAAADRFQVIGERFAGDGPSLLYLARCRKYLVEGVGAEDPVIIHMGDK